MLRGVRWPIFGSLILVALIALAGCSHYWVGEREAWRREAEIACLSSGTVKETPERVRISPINGPGMCGADFPLRISALGESAPLGYDDEALRPPSNIPTNTMPQRWSVTQPYPPPLPPPQTISSQTAGAPMPLTPSGLPEQEDDEGDFTPGPPQPYDHGQLSLPGGSQRLPTYSPRSEPAPLGIEQQVPLGPSRVPIVTGGIGPVAVKPAATLACPIVSALDRWINDAVQPAAMHWFQQPVVEIKQISAYSCRGMNGNPNAPISEHAFGNALDIAEFILADGRKVSVQYGWRGRPEEQGFLHDVQAAACAQFTTVLAPGANVYHYNHIHVDLMRHASGRHICEPAAISGELVAERARARFAAQHNGDPNFTGAVSSRPQRRALGYSGEDDDRLPLAVPGAD